MIGTLARVLSPGGRFGRHQILLFHRVLPEADPLLPGDPSRQAFDALVGTLARHFSILPLDTALDAMLAGRLPPASLSITFDDGYADNYTEALPVLQEHGVSATFFVATGFLDGGRMWNDTVIETVRRLPDGALDLSDIDLGRFDLGPANRHGVIGRLLAAIKHRPLPERQQLADAIGGRADDLPTDLMMTSEQVRVLAGAGMTVGGHTRNHPILACLSDDEARQEMARGKQELEAIVGGDVSLFAYPNGRHGQDYDERHALMARELGFRAAVSTDRGVSQRHSDLWQLPRFTPWDRTHGRFMLRLLMNRYGLVR